MAKVRVVTTTTDLAAIAREVGGPHVEVTAITRGTADPHYVEAKPSYVLKLHRADLLIHIGLELEIGWLPALLTASRNGAIQLGSPGNLNASDGIDVIEVPAVVTRAEGDIHPYGNPHYWTDPRNGVRIADAIAQRLGEIDSANASDYRVRAEEFSSRLADRIAGWERKITPHKGKLVVTYHKSMSYLLRWLGLKQAGAIERKPGIPPSGSHIAALIQMMKTRKVPLVLVETFYPRKDPTMVAEKTGAKLLILPTSVGGRPGIKSYIGLFGAIVKEIAEALAAPRE
ncbi:MAG: zinc ABC transporter substrate-binding protein [Deltaproteobacteria bacterium]|nr:zinc ABC transporter substrate-binding protein [Deltaproteobacteria bacterium]